MTYRTQREPAIILLKDFLHSDFKKKVRRIANEPSITGVVQEVYDTYILIYIETESYDRKQQNQG